MVISNLPDLVHAVKNSSSIENAIETYSGTMGFTSRWVSSVYKSKKELPVLDTSFDVNIAGKDALTSFGVSAETQSSLWTKWELLDDDIKAPWIIDWKNVDFTDPDEIASFLSIISNYILKS